MEMKEIINKLAELKKGTFTANRTKKEKAETEYKKLFNEFKSKYFKELEGSEKQVNWANSIKEKNFQLKLLSIIEINGYLHEDGKGTRRYEKFNEEKQELINQIIAYVNNTSAKEIIETR